MFTEIDSIMITLFLSKWLNKEPLSLSIKIPKYLILGRRDHDFLIYGAHINTLHIGWF